MSSRVYVALRVPASPAEAFDAFTRDIGSWWQPSALFQITPRGDGHLRFEPGVNGRLVTELADGKVFEIGRIKVWEPGARLVFAWRQASFAPEMTTEVEVRFEAAGDETRVSIEHRGWDSIPREHVARHGFPEAETLKRAGEWWRASLDELKAHLKSK